MTEISSPNIERLHTNRELANVYHCSKFVRDWLDNPELPSNYAITLLHSTLFEEVESYSRKGITPNPPGNYRIEDITVGNEPVNFYARGLDVRFLMHEYTSKLNNLLQDLPSAPNGHAKEIIHQAAWAYYTFIRIHPFLDGNGRTSRFILQRILTGSGFRDIIFSQEKLRNGKKYIDAKDRHLDTMQQVDKTGSLDHLELYLAKQLLGRYINPNDELIRDELEKFVRLKKIEITNSSEKKPLSNIWELFSNIDIKQ